MTSVPTKPVCRPEIRSATSSILPRTFAADSTGSAGDENELGRHDACSTVLNEQCVREKRRRGQGVEQARPGKQADHFSDSMTMTTAPTPGRTSGRKDFLPQSSGLSHRTNAHYSRCLRSYDVHNGMSSGRRPPNVDGGFSRRCNPSPLSRRRPCLLVCYSASMPMTCSDCRPYESEDVLPY